MLVEQAQAARAKDGCGAGPMRLTSVPSTRAVPADRGSSPDSTRIRVDFPEPLGPNTTTISPSSTARVRPCRATVPPSPES